MDISARLPRTNPAQLAGVNCDLIAESSSMANKSDSETEVYLSFIALPTGGFAGGAGATNTTSPRRV